MIDDIIAALSIPSSARVGRRVPKTLLVEHGAPTAADRKAIESGIERMDWIASLKPNSIGVAAYADAEREASEIAVLTLQLRPGAKAARLATLLHRAIPYPVLLITQTDTETALSLAPKRHTLAKGGAQVAEATITSPALTAEADEAQAAFLASLALGSLPSASLWALYGGLIERVEGFAAARAGAAWGLPLDAPQALARRAALAEHALAVRDLARVRKAAERERVIAKAVALADAVQQAKERVARAIVALDIGPKIG